MNWPCAILLPLTLAFASDQNGRAASDTVTPLGLEEVLESTRLHYPPLLAAMQEVEVARGDFMAAQGKFDTSIRFATAADRLGFYENERADVGIEQAVRWWGAKLYTGWRIGQGGFAPYNGLEETRDGGEFRAGVQLPLLRGRETDPSRATLEQGRIGVSIAELSVLEQRLIIRQLATAAYWDWVAAGQGLRVARDLLDIALARDGFVRESVAAGALAAIEVTDNRRAILSRRSSAVSAEQKLQKAAMYLSLYYRDAYGDPLVPSETQVPPAFPEPPPFENESVDDDIAAALERRPELGRVRASIDSVRVDETLANNTTEPSLDLKVGVTAESGTNPDVKRGPTELKAGLTLAFPVQQRSANGKLLKARAKLLQLQRKEQFVTDKIEVEVREATFAVDASYRRVELLREEIDVARELETLERERYELGDSNLFTVNLREEAAANAAFRGIQALAEFYHARALLELVTAEP